MIREWVALSNIKKGSTMPKFTLYWLDGRREAIKGDDPSHALNQAGLGIEDLDTLAFWAYGDDDSYRRRDRAQAEAWKTGVYSGGEHLRRLHIRSHTENREETGPARRIGERLRAGLTRFWRGV